MKKLHYLTQLLLASAAFTSLAFAAIQTFDQPARLTPKNPLRAVDTGIGPRADLDLYSTAGAQAEVDDSQKRSLVELRDSEKDAYHLTAGRLSEFFDCASCSRDNFYVFANFIHGKFGSNLEDPSRYWIAVFPKTTGPQQVKVDQVTAQLQWFADGVGAHAQTRIRFSYQGKDQKRLHRILLIPQTGKSNPSWQTEVVDLSSEEQNLSQDLEPSNQAYDRNLPIAVRTDVVYSLYGLQSMEKKGTWSALDGILGEYASTFSLFSTQDRGVDQTNRAFVEQFTYLGDRADAEAIFNQLLAFSKNSIVRNSDSSWTYTQIYNTVFSSCISATLNALFSTGKQGGIEGIDVTLFNPFRFKAHILDEVTEAGQLVFAEDQTFNEEFEGSVQKKPANKMVDDNIALLKSRAFGRLVRRLAFRTAHHQWTAKQLIAAFSALKSLDLGSMVQHQNFSEALGPVLALPGGINLLNDIASILSDPQVQQELTVAGAQSSESWAELLINFRNTENVKPLQ